VSATPASLDDRAPVVPFNGTQLLFAAVALTVATAAALLAGWAPLGFSIITVFLFAGPHNWLEARYFLSRLPARWGRLTPFFVLAFGGIVVLTAVFGTLVILAQGRWFDSAGIDHVFALWNTALLLWIATLAWMRSRTNPRRDWGWVWPVCLVLIAVAWLAPSGMSLAWVYLHPLMAFWLLDRELGRSRPEWRRPFRLCLLCLPIFLGVLWWRLANAASLPTAADPNQAVTLRERLSCLGCADAQVRENAGVLNEEITRHAGADILSGINSHLLVATHTFLEMLHYGVWVVAMPLIGLRAAPWRLSNVPMARRSPVWQWGVAAFLMFGLLIVLALWGFFLADYPTTRTVYFTIALLHVLAEVPFLLRAL
jgi:hypothetical protein